MNAIVRILVLTLGFNQGNCIKCHSGSLTTFIFQKACAPKITNCIVRTAVANGQSQFECGTESKMFDSDCVENSNNKICYCEQDLCNDPKKPQPQELNRGEDFHKSAGPIFGGNGCSVTSSPSFHVMCIVLVLIWQYVRDYEIIFGS